MDNPQARWQVLEHALRTDNVQQTCKTFGISRTLYYKWKRRFEAEGMAGLEDKIPQKPLMPNRVGEDAEKAILDQVAKTPKDGPRQICYALHQLGIEIGETGVYRVMKRHGLNLRSERLAYARQRARQRMGLRHLAKLDVRLREPEHQIPGFLLMETLRTWQPVQGQAPVYLYALYDVHSKWGLIKLYSDKASINVADFYSQRISQLVKTFKLPVYNILSEQQPGFEEQWQRRKLSEPRVWELPPGKTTLIEPLEQFINVICQSLTGSLMEKPAQTGSRGEGRTAFADLEKLLENRLRIYNFKQVQGERTPTETILAYLEGQGIDPETLPLWVYLRMV